MKVTLVSVCLCAATLHGCSIPDRGPAVPPPVTSLAELPGFEGMRYYPVDDTDRFLRDAIAARDRSYAFWRANGQEDVERVPLHYLAISGGGDHGAFGAGLLAGWSAHGSRPEFHVVTGISTGAMIAPFVFAGSDYDGVLRSTYTSINASDILEERGMLAILFDDALNDSTPLHQLLEEKVDQALLDRIADEWTAKGRWLLVATTDLDARRQVIWNMGAIAASQHPDALSLFRRVMLASSSIPGIFPPVMFDVEVNGRPYQEMHVDGGAIVQTFFLHSSFATAIRQQNLVTDREKRLYVIRNARLDPDWASVDRRALTILGRAILSLLQSQGIDDLFRIYLHAKTDGMDFNLAYIGRDFVRPYEEMFDQEYMKELFHYGFQAALEGYSWHKTPPNHEEHP